MQSTSDELCTRSPRRGIREARREPTDPKTNDDDDVEYTREYWVLGRTSSAISGGPQTLFVFARDWRLGSRTYASLGSRPFLLPFLISVSMPGLTPDFSAPLFGILSYWSLSLCFELTCVCYSAPRLALVYTLVRACYNVATISNTRTNKINPSYQPVIK